MKIMSINCQNNENNRNDRLSDGNINPSSILSSYIKNNDYDFIGTQEMSSNFTEHMENNLSGYKFSGKYRNDFKILRIFFPRIRKLKENNKIILKGNVIYEKTISLPWIPLNIKELYRAIKRKSLMRRIASGVLVQTDELGPVYFLNTHLDYAIKSVQKRQLKRIYKHIYIKRINYPVVITGDFNMEISDKSFKKFVHQLEKINIKRVPINDKTNALKYRNKSAIDHIFIPSECKIVNSGVIIDNNLKSITDHLPIFVEIKK